MNLLRPMLQESNQGIITADGQAATVTFTDSTWDYLQNGSVFRYTNHLILQISGMNRPLIRDWVKRLRMDEDNLYSLESMVKNT